ncbi:hypothetical protein D3C80_1938690 [compost metagenome]
MVIARSKEFVQSAIQPNTVGEGKSPKIWIKSSSLPIAISLSSGSTQVIRASIEGEVRANRNVIANPRTINTAMTDMLLQGKIA